MTTIEQTGLAEELARVQATWGEHLENVTVKQGRICGLQRFMFTWAILADVTAWGYGDRWCFATRELAAAAFDAWDGTDEPTGWHRHPDSGRRRHADGTEEIYH